MLELNNEKTDFIKSLFNANNEHFPLIKSILSGKKKGRIYVNSIENLYTAAIMSEDGWFYLLGNEYDEDFNRELENIIIQKMRNENKSILWSGIPQNWRNRIKTNDSLRIEEFPRIQYKFDYNKYTLNSFTSPSYLLKSINKENIDKVFNYCDDIESFWGTEENFIKYGFGFILLDKGNIVGHALSASVEDNEIEIDIQTDKSYRGHGIATYLASCLIDECIKRNQKTS